MISKLASLRHHAGFIKYFKNTSWLFAEKILRMVVGLFVGVWVARYLGPEQFGLLSYAGSFVGLFAALATLGLDSIVIRELVKDERRSEVLLGTAFWLKLVGAGTVLILLEGTVQFTSGDRYTNTLILLIAAAMIFQSFNVINFYFQARVLSKYIVYANMIALSLSGLAKISLILYEAPLIAFAVVVLFDSVVSALGMLYFFRKYSAIKFKNLRFSPSAAAALLKDSWPLIFSGIAISVYMKIDQVMIKEMVNSEAVGQYAAAVKLCEAWYFIPVVIASSLFPAIINAKKQSEALYYVRLQRLYNFMVWLALVIAVAMSFLGGWIVDLLYGSQYSQASDVLIVYVWSGVFVFFGTAWSKWMVLENQQATILKLHILSMISNVILNLILIPHFGIIGATLATLISYALGHTVFALFFKNQVPAVKMFWATLNVKQVLQNKGFQ